MENGENAAAMEERNADGVDQVVEELSTPTKTTQSSTMDDGNQIVDDSQRKYCN